MYGSRGPKLEQLNALRDTQQHCREYGMRVTFKLRVETEVGRDKYNSINRSVGETAIPIYTFPFEMQPNTKQLERAGIFEQHEAVAWTPARSWQDRDFDFESIDITRMTVVIDGVTYEVAEKGRSSQFLGVYLYWTFGLRRR